MAGQRNQFRVIGGTWRGRRLAFYPGPDLRPTPDRVRETIFNWLMPLIDGARVLDLFAGSGALGFEAASRGAALVMLVDSHPRVVQQLKHNVQLLNAEQIRVQQADVLRFLQQPAEPFDIVLLDPPYRAGVLPECIVLLEQQGWLKPEAYIYLEHASADSLPELPVNWQLHRSKDAGQVAYHLAKRQAAT